MYSKKYLPDRAVEPEQWLQCHPEAGSSWPSWPKASHLNVGWHAGEHPEDGVGRREGDAREAAEGRGCLGERGQGLLRPLRATDRVRGELIHATLPDLLLLSVCCEDLLLLSVL